MPGSGSMNMMMPAGATALAFVVASDATDTEISAW